MEARAAQLGVGRTLHYIFPDNVFLRGDDPGTAP